VSDLTKDDIAKLSLNDLRELANQVEEEIHSRREEGRRWLRQHGLVEKNATLYRNPKNSRETWSGRGSRPEWVEAALAAGLTLEQLEVDGGSDKNLPAPTHKAQR
jgi:hypothetical protein